MNADPDDTTDDTPDDKRAGGDAATAGRERIAKRIARAGLGSRREAEAMIAEGRVAVNGTVIASPALDVSADDMVTVDGAALPKPERTRLWRYHKPAGRLVSRIDPHGRPTIYADLPKELQRLIAVGRLDFNSEGLLLLTNDGELSRRLELPAGGLVRRYRARAFGHVDQKALDRLADGITVEGVEYGPIQARLEEARGANAWIALSLAEGKNREVRNVLAALGLQVNRLIRTQYGSFALGDLPVGAAAEVPAATLMRELGLSPEKPKGWARAKPRTNPMKKPRKNQRPGRNARMAKRAETGEQAPRGEASRGDHRPGDHRPGDRRPSGRIQRSGGRDEAHGERFARGDRPQRPYRERGEGNERREFGGDRSERPQRPFRERRDEQRGERREFRSERPDRSERPQRPFRERGDGKRFDNRGPREERREDRPQRPFRERSGEPRGERREFRGERAERSDRPQRPFRESANDNGSRVDRKRTDERGGRRFEKSGGERRFDKSPRVDKGPRRDDRPRRDEQRGERRFDDRPRDGERRPFDKARSEQRGGERRFDKRRDQSQGGERRFSPRDGERRGPNPGQGPRGGPRTGPRGKGPGGKGPRRGPARG